MSKKTARRFLQSIKRGLTVKEFLTLCDDMGIMFDDVLPDDDLLMAYEALKEGE